MAKGKGFNSRNFHNMGGMGGMNAIRQAQKMTSDMQKTQTSLQQREYAAQSGGGTVKVVVNGGHQMKSITINPEALDPNDVEFLQDMILAAVNEAMKAADEDAAATMSRITGGLNLGKLGL